MGHTQQLVNQVVEEAIADTAGRVYRQARELLASKGYDVSHMPEKHPDFPRPAQLRPEQLVYLVRVVGTQKVKIGYTTSLEARLTAFASSNPDPLEVVGLIQDASREVEADLQVEFGEQHITGEWYDLADEHLAQVEKRHPGALLTEPRPVRPIALKSHVAKRIAAKA